MTRFLIVRPQAQREADLAADWYDGKTPGLGNDFLEEFDATARSVQDNPFKNQLIYRNVRRAPLDRFPYSLIYSVSETEIVIVSCFRGRRDPKRWQSRTHR